MVRRIKSLPKDLRPREKLLKYGVEALSLEELLSAILITGTKSKDVSKLAQGISSLLKNPKSLTKDKLLDIGLGQTKTAQILAALEVSVRVKEQKVSVAMSAEHIVSLSNEIVGSDKENLLCFYLNARGEILKKELVAVGTLNSALVKPGEIFGLVKELPVAAIILVHNHPSGNLVASVADIKLTKRLKLAGEILGVKLLDHLIVSKNGWSKIKV